MIHVFYLNTINIAGKPTLTGKWFVFLTTHVCGAVLGGTVGWEGSRAAGLSWGSFWAQVSGAL